jgi:hypothetical protein
MQVIMRMARHSRRLVSPLGASAITTAAALRQVAMPSAGSGHAGGTPGPAGRCLEAKAGRPGRLAQEMIMAISNETDVTNEIAHQKHPETPAERHQRLEKSLELGLEETFPASDAVSIVQPAPPLAPAGKSPEVRSDKGRRT